MRNTIHDVPRNDTNLSRTAFGRFRRTSLFVRRFRPAVFTALLLAVAFPAVALAHPLGNFTINHFTRIEVSVDRLRVRYVVDMAEIPAFQELRAMATGESGTPSEKDLDAYLQRVAAQYAGGLVVQIDGARVQLTSVGAKYQLRGGEAGLNTFRVECDYEAALAGAGAARRLRFENMNQRDRIGWREIVVVPSSGITIFNSTAFANGITDEIRDYPRDMLLAPLDERVAELTFGPGTLPAGAIGLQTREGRPFGESSDRFGELIAVRELTLLTALLGLLIAAGLGALHALSPGHGKTVVGAYLIGSRGTARHAIFLGLTVTITHTIGVIALGLVTLFASQYVVPERLFPILGFISGGLVFAVGLTLFIRRLRVAVNHSALDKAHHHTHDHDHDHTHDHTHDHAHDHVHHHDHAHSGGHSHADPGVETAEAHSHSHGGHSHTHLPPGADGDRITWRSLLALGISGGLLPCPSALVVMLSAIALHRVAYGLLLVVAFSVGLACTLTAIGLAFVYAGRLMKGRLSGSGRVVRWLPAISALVIACLGIAICYRALVDAGVTPPAAKTSQSGVQISSRYRVERE